MKKGGALFCDRDGVLIEAVTIDGKPKAIETLSEIRYCFGVEAAIKRIKREMPVFMITNQPEISRGSISKQSVDSINNKILHDLSLTAIFMCPHDDKDECGCRKPKIGLLEMAAQEFQIDLSRSFMIGDRWRDIACAHAGGLKAFFIDRNYDEQHPDPPFFSINHMAELPNLLLSKAVIID